MGFEIFKDESSLFLIPSGAKRMNCREFERLWNERLDVARTFAPEVEEEMERHEENCPRCRQASARFEALERTIRSWRERERPEPSVAFSELVEWRLDREKTRESSATFRRRFAAQTVAAAAIVLTFALAVPSRNPPAPAGSIAKTADRPRASERSLAFEAVSEATEATWRWAGITSGPAARMGMRAWDSARPKLEIEVPSPAEFVVLPAGSATRANASRLADRLHAHVQPVSSSARRAFGFLLPPS